MNSRVSEMMTANANARQDTVWPDRSCISALGVITSETRHPSLIYIRSSQQSLALPVDG
jgi:hypothetical protein